MNDTNTPKLTENPDGVSFSDSPCSTIRSAIEEVERAHFRTEHDTGSNHHAMFILNSFRRIAGLPSLTEADLPQWNEQVREYVMPEGSRLLSNVVVR